MENYLFLVPTLKHIFLSTLQRCDSSVTHPPCCCWEAGCHSKHFCFVNNLAFLCVAFKNVLLPFLPDVLQQFNRKVRHVFALPFPLQLSEGGLIWWHSWQVWKIFSSYLLYYCLIHFSCVRHLSFSSICFLAAWYHIFVIHSEWNYQYSFSVYELPLYMFI